MIEKIVIAIALAALGFLMFSNVFRFRSTSQISSSIQSVENVSQNTTLPQTLQNPQNFPFSFDPATWAKVVSDWFNSVLKSFSDYITNYLKGIFPKATPTFGNMVTALIILFILYLLATKFENIFRAIILALIIVVVVMLIVSAVGLI